MATLATPIRDASDVFNPNVVKAVVARSGLALYFTRAPSPWQRAAFSRPPEEIVLGPESGFLRHVGLYAYRARTLLELAGQVPVPLETAESLEQLRAR